jgi:hypothetical protein
VTLLGDREGYLEGAPELHTGRSRRGPAETAARRRAERAEGGVSALGWLDALEALATLITSTPKQAHNPHTSVRS